MSNADYELLPERMLTDIARRCGNGWFTNEFPVRPAKDFFSQWSRIKNYEIVIERAAPFVRDRNGMDARRRVAIWRHVCVEVDLMLHDGTQAPPPFCVQIGHEITSEMVVAYAAAVGECGASAMSFAQFLSRPTWSEATTNG
jgi:hypothetical protein